MKVWPKPFIYTLFHILIGFVAYTYPIILIGVLLYQFGQLFLGIRVFFCTFTIEEGNSVEHTLVKVSEVALGYLIAMLCGARH